MKRTNNWAIALLLLCCQCGVSEVSEPELLLYLRDPENGLTGIVEKNGVRLQVNYRPSDLVMLSELEMLQDKGDRKAAVRRFDSVTYFVMQFSMNGHEIETMYAGDQHRFGESIEYLSYGIANDLIAVANRDTINVLDVAYSRAFGSAGVSQLIVAFDDDLRRRSGNVRVILNDHSFGTGKSEFEFDCDNLNKTPRIKIQ